MTYMRKTRYMFAGIVTLLLIGLGGFSYYQYYKNKNLNTQIGSIQKQLSLVSQSLQKTEAVNKQTQQVQTEPKNSNTQNTAPVNGTAVLASSAQPLTGAVAQVSPSVVSIVISKNVPKVQVKYENPFAGDPNFQGMNIQVPVYSQDGTQSQEIGAGTGFIVRQDGYIITNKHVVDDDQASYTVVLASGAKKPATVVYKDPNNDLAIIKIDGSGYPAVTFGDSSALQLGQTVAAIGNALGEYSNSVSVGIVAGLNRTIEASDELGNTEDLSGIIQTDVAINPGNSGGPLLDLSGKVVGINVATVVGSNNIAFAIPINEARNIVSKILNI